MTESFEHLLRSTMIQTAQEAVPVNLIPRTFAAAHKRRNVKLALAGVATVAAIAFGAPLTFAASGQPTPVPSVTVPSSPVPQPSPSGPAPQPVPAPSLSHQFPCPGGTTDPGSPCHLIPVPSPRSPY